MKWWVDCWLYLNLFILCRNKKLDINVSNKRTLWLQGDGCDTRYPVNKLNDELTDQACVMGCVFLISPSIESIENIESLRPLEQLLCAGTLEDTLYYRKLFSFFFFATTQAIILLIGKLNISQAISMCMAQYNACHITQQRTYTTQLNTEHITHINTEHTPCDLTYNVCPVTQHIRYTAWLNMYLYCVTEHRTCTV